ncbi:MAG: carboxypeptidase regulatory-like domain-containing protein, partial [Acidobacteria bacterium]
MTPRSSSRTRRAARAWLSSAIAGLLSIALAAAAGSAPVARDVAGTDGIARAAGVVLRGVTVDALGRTVAGVQILVTPGGADAPSSPVRRVSSDAAGRFVVDGLAPGSYRLVAAKSGYALLVSRVDTLLETTVDLVLHPAGPPGEPGTRPADASWVLRLPGRDLLEDREADAAGATLAADRAPAVPAFPFSLVFDGMHESGGDVAEGPGYGVEARGTLPLRGRGALDLRVAHRRLGDDTGRRSDEDRIVATLHDLSATRNGLLATATLEAGRHARGFFGATRPEVGVDEQDVCLSLGLARTDGGRAFDAALTVGFASFGQREATGPAESVARWSVHARSRLEIATGADATTSATVELGTVRHADGREGADGTVLVAGPAAGDLDLLSGTSIRGRLEHRRALAPDLAIVGVVGVDHDDDAARPGTVGRVETGLLWQVAPEWSLSARGGWAPAEGGDGRGVFSLAAERAGERWSFRIVRERAVGGVDPGVEMPGDERQATVLLASRTTTIDRWSAEARWDPRRPDRPAVALVASWSTLDGEAAARLPGDLLRVPVVADARADRALVALDVSLARTGTSVGLTIEDVDQAGGSAAFVDGARGWSR